MKTNGSLSPVRTGCFIALVVFSAVIAGCSERLSRENVFADTATGLGLFITENPKTQLYEGKLGYFRHEVFFVPTNKTITYEQKDSKSLLGLIFGTFLEKEPASTDPSKTPQVLAELAAGGEVSQKTGGFQVRQRLAVGRAAVTAPSAIALMADDANDAKVIERLGAGLPVESRPIVSRFVGDVYDSLDKLDPNRYPEARRHIGNLKAAAGRLLTLERINLGHVYTFETKDGDATLTKKAAPELPSANLKNEPVDAAIQLLKNWWTSVDALRGAVERIDSGKKSSVRFPDDGQPRSLSKEDVEEIKSAYDSYRRIWQAFEGDFSTHPDIVAAVNYYISIVAGQR
jgi:hypothetical protein